MTYKKIKNFLLIIIIIILLDFLLTYFLFSKFNLYNIFYPNFDHRISNDYYHHSFKENVNTTDFWGDFSYNFITNSLGFKDKQNRAVDKKTKLKKRIIINGDSFVEGIGIEYKKTFVGMLDNYLYEKNIEILNAGVASQSPILYYKKIFHILEIQNLEFDELILFLDISDIPDEFFYSEDDYTDGKLKKDLRDRLQDFMVENSSVYLFFDVFFSQVELLKNKFFLRYEASKFYKINLFQLTKNQINIYKAINVERGNWIHDELYWNKYGISGRDLAEKNLNKLYLLCKKYNIKFTLVLYPWPKQIYYKVNNNRHNKFWEDWAHEKNINFIDLNDEFNKLPSLEVIDRYFIKGDIHWNEEGHKYIYDLMKKYYFEIK